jgi:hypothetical protein
MKLALALLVACGCSARDATPVTDGGSAAGEFVAMARDFAPFRAWRAVALGDQPNTADPPGPRTAFVRLPPDAGAHDYPVGAMIVKAIENTPSPTNWDLFAMAKRGGDFDPSGAVGWEFFLLKLDGDDTIQVVARGTVLTPPVDAGMAYGSVGAIFCSGCHGAPGTAATDHVLSPQLAP